MLIHRRRLATQISPATPIGPQGSTQTASSSASPASRNERALPRRRLLESNAVWVERWSQFEWYRPLLFFPRGVSVPVRYVDHQVAGTVGNGLTSQAALWSETRSVCELILFSVADFR